LAEDIEVENHNNIEENRNNEQPIGDIIIDPKKLLEIQKNKYLTKYCPQSFTKTRT
jgi:predicted nucleic-acid-binding Zn-ribbon protein